IDKSANLGDIIAPITKGGYYHAGQVCVSVQRIYAHAEIVDEFVEMFREKVHGLVVGDPLLAETEVGPLIKPAEADRVASWINEAACAGAKR
ncbi:aldehyde dehydrogenase family protein, partial [Rhizobium leguminosarum]|uniref:aldehyde dehydrogenase family protein n=2 Tax=Rhizobium/Agrobacterium group TaxID=227290 RepID=UPI003F9E463D